MIKVYLQAKWPPPAEQATVGLTPTHQCTFSCSHSIPFSSLELNTVRTKAYSDTHINDRWSDSDSAFILFVHLQYVDFIPRKYGRSGYNSLVMGCETWGTATDDGYRGM